MPQTFLKIIVHNVGINIQLEMLKNCTRQIFSAKNSDQPTDLPFKIDFQARKEVLKCNTISDFHHSSMQSYVIEGVDFIGEVSWWGAAEHHLGDTRPQLKPEANLPQV